MVLEDSAIQAACNGATPLIEKFDAKFLSPCAYSFRIGRVYEPETGDELIVGKLQGLFAKTASNAIRIEPSGTLVVTTMESVRLPNDILMTYSPLQSLASRGLMLLNASVAEPGYHGPLSCVLVNFSSVAIALRPGDRIAKAVFVKLGSMPGTPRPQVLERTKYEAAASDAAARYHKSFLDIDAVVSKAAAEATSSAKKALVYGGGFLLVLLTFAQLEPLITKYLRDHTGIVSTSTMEALKAEEAALKADQEALKADQEAQKANQVLMDAQTTLQALKTQIQELKNATRESSREGDKENTREATKAAAHASPKPPAK